MKQIILGLSAVAALTLPVAAAALDTLAKIRDKQTIVLAYRVVSSPFSYLDKNKQPTGYAVELCVKAAEAVKRELKLPNLNVRFIPVDSATRFTAITDGTADLECGTTTNNAERRQIVAFSIPFFFSGVRALVRSDAGIRNWPDLRNRTVVTTKSTTTVALLNERNNVRSLNIKLLEGSDDMDSFMHVEQGKADVFPMDDVLLYSLRAGAKNPKAFSIVGDPLSVEPYAIMLRKGDPAFKKIVDAEMIQLINSGEIYRIYNRWFMQPIPPNGINLNMPMGFLLRDSWRYPSDKVGEL
ncbi:MAG TPA: amino acid ABC transporter substrate-binding protein [Noviherbaspirillum sp.]|nr:amino acid ABC transporter substrate-binding protein [Noviherbaspirillum sp.]